MQVTSNGISLEIAEDGPGGHTDAPPILLIRGLGTQMIQWPDEFRRTLIERGSRLVMFDNRDVGLSQKLAPDGIARQLAAVMNSGSRHELLPGPRGATRPPDRRSPPE